MKTWGKRRVYIGLSLNNDNVKYCQLVPHLPGLRGRGETWVNSIKLANRHHARVYLVVQLEGEYRDQHDVNVNVDSPEKLAILQPDLKHICPSSLFYRATKRVFATLM